MAEIVVALDVPDRSAALALLDRLGPEADFVKVGLELFVAEGPAMVKDLRERGLRIFLDLKLHDIPATVAGAVRSAAGLGVELLTVHAAGGRRMLEAAAGAAPADLTLLGVTVLTSLDPDELSEAWGRERARPVVEVDRLATLARAAGIAGVVASPHEAARLRARLGPGVPIVTPGIRLAGDGADDQRRVATPAEAVSAGATHLVVGRTVTRASEPASALSRVRAEVSTHAAPALTSEEP